MFIDPKKYFFIKDAASVNLVGDLKIINEQLGTYGGDVLPSLNAEESLLTIGYPKTTIKSTLEIKKPSKFSDTQLSRQMILTCESDDNASINILRLVTAKMGYRVFNPNIGCYVVNDPNIIDTSTAEINPVILRLLADKNFEPIFAYRNSHIFFVRKNPEGSVYLINPDLLAYLMTHKDNYDEKDFSVEVAPSTGKFVALFDRGLTPNLFYKIHGKVVNLSGFNALKLERDVFVRPVFFEYDEHSQKFKQFKGGAEIRGELEKGESIAKYALTAMLNLGVKGELLTVKVGREIDYEKDEKRILKPRLNISIFFDSGDPASSAG